MTWVKSPRHAKIPLPVIVHSTAVRYRSLVIRPRIEATNKPCRSLRGVAVLRGLLGIEVRCPTSGTSRSSRNQTGRWEGVWLRFEMGRSNKGLGARVGSRNFDFACVGCTVGIVSVSNDQFVSQTKPGSRPVKQYSSRIAKGRCEEHHSQRHNQR